MVKKLTRTVPPKRGPLSQGLNNQYKKVKTNRENPNGKQKWQNSNSSLK